MGISKIHQKYKDADNPIWKISSAQGALASHFKEEGGGGKRLSQVIERFVALFKTCKERSLVDSKMKLSIVLLALFPTANCVHLQLLRHGTTTIQETPFSHDLLQRPGQRCGANSGGATCATGYCCSKQGYVVPHPRIST